MSKSWNAMLISKPTPFGRPSSSTTSTIFHTSDRPERVAAASDPAAAMAGADGMINTTPIGMANHPGLPLPKELLRPSHWVAEIVYFPLETELLRTARALGCRTMNGGDMAVFQAVEAFRLFTGIAPDATRMLRHFASMGG